MVSSRPVRERVIETAADIPVEVRLAGLFDHLGMIGSGMSAGGCADASLYGRLSARGLTELRCFPQLVAVRPGSPRLIRYQQQILAVLNPVETAAWWQAVERAERDDTFFIAQPFHCAVAAKPA